MINNDFKKEIDKRRFKFLHRLYKLSGGYKYNRFNMTIMGQELDYDEGLTGEIVKYLQEKGLIEFDGLDGRIGITQQGVFELEEALSNPDKPTKYFPPV